MKTSLTNAEFSEAAAANLCLPAPACVGREGEVIRGQGNFGECSEDTHQLLDNIATSRVRVAGPQDSRKGWRRT